MHERPARTMVAWRRSLASWCNPKSFAGPQRTTVEAMFPGAPPLPHQAADGTSQRIVDGPAPVARGRGGDDAAGPVRLEPGLTVHLHASKDAHGAREPEFGARNQPRQAARGESGAPDGHVTQAIDFLVARFDEHLDFHGAASVVLKIGTVTAKARGIKQIIWTPMIEKIEPWPPRESGAAGGRYSRAPTCRADRIRLRAALGSCLRRSFRPPFPPWTRQRTSSSPLAATRRNGSLGVSLLGAFGLARAISGAPACRRGVRWSSDENLQPRVADGNHRRVSQAPLARDRIELLDHLLGCAKHHDPIALPERRSGPRAGRLRQSSPHRRWRRP